MRRKHPRRKALFYDAFSFLNISFYYSISKYRIYKFYKLEIRWTTATVCFALTRRNCTKIETNELILEKLTRIVLTSATSTIVGTTLKTKAVRTKLIPRVPRSIAFERAPVWRWRWNPKSRLWRWLNRPLPIERIECCATEANTALRNSLRPDDPARTRPTEKRFEIRTLNPI